MINSPTTGIKTNKDPAIIPGMDNGNITFKDVTLKVFSDSTIEYTTKDGKSTKVCINNCKVTMPETKKYIQVSYILRKIKKGAEDTVQCNRAEYEKNQEECKKIL